MKKTDSNRLKIGDKLSRISFMTVKSSGAMGCEVQNEDGFTWRIGDGVIEEECFSGQYNHETKISRTEMAEMLMSARDALVVVNFNKQATAESIQDRINELIVMSESKAKKSLTELLKGEERTLTGYVVGAEPVLGRTVVIDLYKQKEIRVSKDGIEWDSRQRQVDHRSLNWLIYKNVKYTVK